MVRTWISLVIAVVFAIAAMPGSMAMPAPKPMSHAIAMSGDCSSCDHMKAQKDQGKPCKNMAMCLGLLSCFGMGTVDVAVSPAPVLFASEPVAFLHQSLSGLTHRPDNPPPIV